VHTLRLSRYVSGVAPIATGGIHRSSHFTTLLVELPFALLKRSASGTSSVSKMAGDRDTSKHVDQDTCFTNYTSVTSRAFATSLILEFVGESLIPAACFPAVWCGHCVACGRASAIKLQRIALLSACGSAISLRSSDCPGQGGVDLSATDSQRGTQPAVVHSKAMPLV
jgi:hypothetical protein